jgi:hypothetical protein
VRRRELYARIAAKKARHDHVVQLRQDAVKENVFKGENVRAQKGKGKNACEPDVSSEEMRGRFVVLD